MAEPEATSLLCGKIRLRLTLGKDTVALGPGKADLLDAVRSSGSVSAAAKAMGMSYRRAWLLVETMNSCFTMPLVKCVRGGSGGGGAEVTAEGVAVLQLFRCMQAEVDSVVERYLPYFSAGTRGTLEK